MWADLLLSALPIIAVCLLLILRVRALLTAGVGLAIAALTVTVRGSHGWSAIVEDLWSWGPTVLEIAAILGGGIALALVLERSGAQETIATWMSQCAQGVVGTTLLVVHGIVPFAESITGFGVGVTVGVPLLISLGLTARKAASVSLLGLCLVPWGALGPGTIVAGQLVDQSPEAVGVASAWPTLVVTVGVGLAAVCMVTDKPTPRVLLAGALSGVLLWGSVFLASLTVGMSVTGAVGALLLIVVHLVWSAGRNGVVLPSSNVLRSLLPYAVVVVGVLVTSRLGYGRDGGLTAAVMRSPALWLSVGCLVAVALLRLPLDDVRKVVGQASAVWSRTAIPTVAFLALGVVLLLGGLSEVLGEGLRGAGISAVVLSPFLGGLGGWVTGSGAGANSLFIASVATAAGAAKVSVLDVVGVHNVAAGLLTMASPARVLLAVNAAPLASDGQDPRPSLQAVTRDVVKVDLVILAALCVWVALLAVTGTSVMEVAS